MCMFRNDDTANNEICKADSPKDNTRRDETRTRDGRGQMVSADSESSAQPIQPPPQADDTTGRRYSAEHVDVICTMMTSGHDTLEDVGRKLKRAPTKTFAKWERIRGEANKQK